MRERDTFAPASKLGASDIRELASRAALNLSSISQAPVS